MAKIFDTDGLERRVGQEIAKARGCTWKRKDPRERWPDGWINPPSGRSIPLEVVQAFPPQPGADRDDTKGEPWPRAYAGALDEVNRCYQETGRRPSIHGGKPLDADQVPPPITDPIDPIAGVRVAIKKKSTNKYGLQEARRAILGVHHVQWGRLTPDELKRTADYARQIGAPFCEIWVVSEYKGEPAQQVV